VCVLVSHLVSLEQAEGLLRRTDLPTVAVGRAGGYPNASHFNAVPEP
jgi:transcriptional regulator GlxA family with amidase domain